MHKRSAKLSAARARAVARRGADAHPPLLRSLRCSSSRAGGGGLPRGAPRGGAAPAHLALRLRGSSSSLGESAFRWVLTRRASPAVLGGWAGAGPTRGSGTTSLPRGRRSARVGLAHTPPALPRAQAYSPELQSGVADQLGGGYQSLPGYQSSGLQAQSRSASRGQPLHPMH